MSYYWMLPAKSSLCRASRATGLIADPKFRVLDCRVAEDQRITFSTFHLPCEVKRPILAEIPRTEGNVISIQKM